MNETQRPVEPVSTRPKPSFDGGESAPVEASERSVASAGPERESAGPLPRATKGTTEPEPLPPRMARQGRKGWPVLYVLVGGLLLAGLVWGLVEIYGGAIAPEEPVGDPATVPIEELETQPAN